MECDKFLAIWFGLNWTARAERERQRNGNKEI